ncbi:MAG: hypothetical protein LBM20_07245 [Rikenellaceae bacterium]|jgi:hypothetical protein|nr:hypothetical protein [Rikenellaceae bacterium]
MKKFYLTALLLFPLVAWGQFRPIYLLNDFAEARVTFKDGRVVQALMNYDTVGEDFVFMDNGEVKIMSGMTGVLTVSLDGRSFFEQDGLLLERVPLPDQKYYYVRWWTDYGSSGGGYGGSTVIASVDKQGMTQDGVLFYVDDKDGNVIFKNRYFAMINGRPRNIATIRALAKLYKPHEQEILDYANAEKLDFKKPEDVHKLMIFCAPFMQSFTD